MKKYIIILSFLSLSAVSALAQTQCTNDPPMSLPQSIVGPDTTEHQTKSHWSATGSATPDQNGNPVPNPTSDAITGTCGYTHGTNANCTTTCTVNFSGIASDTELGILSASGSHVVNHGSQNGTSTATGAGASCTGFFGAGTANCFGVIFGTCTPAVSVSAGGVTISTAGTVVWKSSPNPASLSCAAKLDPQNQVGGGGGGCTCLSCVSVPTTIGGFSNDSLAVAPNCSPIIIDVDGTGFHLTSASNGVMFDISGTGHPVQIAWTDPAFHNAFLALPGADGLVHNGKQLFGNFTPQPASEHPNGFLALAEYDKPENGGNGDNVIDDKDAVFSRLRLWIDENHDGISQPNELHPLEELGIHALALGYFESGRKDEFGNQFRYRARVNPDKRRERQDKTASGEPGRWAYDVFFTTN